MNKYYTSDSECNGSNAISTKFQCDFTTPTLSIEDAIKTPMFTREEAVRIRYLLDHLPMKRKDAEADSTVPYLPSFAQAVNPKLAITCGFIIDSSPACDSTRRKIYHFREVRENEQF